MRAAYQPQSAARASSLSAVPAGWSTALHRESLGNSAGRKVQSPPGGLELPRVQALMDGTGAAGACAATRKHFRDAQLQQAVIQS